jgi:hypothetical protein
LGDTEQFDLDLLALGDLFLLAPGCDYCVHGEGLLYRVHNGATNRLSRVFGSITHH